MPALRVLIFDDDLVEHQEFLRDSFANLDLPGFARVAVTYRGHADGAVAAVEESGADIVFMDFQMGKHDDGATAVRALRAAYSYEALPILAISSDSRFNQRMLAVGATESCVKMVLPGNLAALMTLLLATRAT